MTSRQQIAKEHGITPGRVSQLAAQGCPVDDPEAAREWIRNQVKRPDRTPLALPPEAARLRMGPLARLHRTADAERIQHSLWRAAVESGTASPRTIAELHSTWDASRKSAAAAEKEYSDFLLKLGCTVNKAAMLKAIGDLFTAIRQDFLSHQPWGETALAIVNRHLATASAPLNQQPTNQPTK
jgi:hypothetical protein